MAVLNHLPIFSLMSSYKGLETKKNFKVGSNEIAARLQYLKKKPASHRACSHHTVCRRELGEVGQFAECAAVRVCKQLPLWEPVFARGEATDRASVKHSTGCSLLLNL